MSHFVLRISLDETMKSVFRYIEKNWDDESEKEFELWTVFPIYTFDKSENWTLRELGLYPKRALTMHYQEDPEVYKEPGKVVKKSGGAGLYIDSDSEFIFNN